MQRNHPRTRRTATKETVSPVRKTIFVPSDCVPSKPVVLKSAPETVPSNPASLRSTNTSHSCPTNFRPSSEGSSTFPTALKQSASPMPLNESVISSSLIFHLLSRFRPSFSSTERMFLLLTIDTPLNSAVFLAARFHCQFHRPLQMLLAAFIYADTTLTSPRPKPMPPSTSQ